MERYTLPLVIVIILLMVGIQGLAARLTPPDLESQDAVEEVTTRMFGQGPTAETLTAEAAMNAPVPCLAPEPGDARVLAGDESTSTYRIAEHRERDSWHPPDRGCEPPEDDP